MKIQRILFPLGMVASIAIAAACGSTTPTTETPGGDTTGSGTGPTTSSTATDTSTSSGGTVNPVTSNTTPTPSTSTSAATPSGPQKWSDLKNDSERGNFMSKVIVPTMKPVFQEFDGAKYGKFACATCHGPNMKTPKEFLPKLTLAGTTFKVAPDKAAMLKFMMEKVTPKMAEAMGEKPFDPATKTGFGCGGCHVVEMK